MSACHTHLMILARAIAGYAETESRLKPFAWVVGAAVSVLHRLTA